MTWETWASANQIVSYNLRRARELRGWTQAEAAERLEPYIGSRWSGPTWSIAERGRHEDPDDPSARIRHFSADDLVALSAAFDLPLAWWFLPPDDLGDSTSIQHADGEEGIDREGLLRMVLGTARYEDVRDRVGELDQEERRHEVEEARKRLETMRTAASALVEQVNDLTSQLEELEEEA